MVSKIEATWLKLHPQPTQVKTKPALMDMGVPQGKEIGQILSWLLDQVLEDPQLNERETLTRMAEEKRDAK